MSDFDNRSRKLARERYWDAHDKDRYTCPDCGRERVEIVGGFQVHHKSGNPHDNRLEHLVALCGFCHRLRENKKPSLERIRRFRENNRADKPAHLSPVVNQFIDERACLCSEGRDYGWVDPLALWFDTFESYIKDRCGQSRELTDGLKSELVLALLASPETSLEFHDNGIAVLGPDVHGRRSCSCLSSSDISYKNIGGADE